MTDAPKKPLSEAKPFGIKPLVACIRIAILSMQDKLSAEKKKSNG